MSEAQSNDDSKKDQVARMLYHLGKGIWKSIPILGPIVEEVVYEQFEGPLKGGVDKLPKEQLDEIFSRLPSLEALKNIENTMSELSMEERLLAMENHTEVIKDLSQFRHEMQTGFASVIEIVKDLKKEFGESKELERTLELIERRRLSWEARISANQRRLLDKIPETYAPVDSLWKYSQAIVQDCNYKEFRFRLHELEWLGLIERKFVKDTWLYRRISKIKEN